MLDLRDPEVDAEQNRAKMVRERAGESIRMYMYKTLIWSLCTFLWDNRGGKWCPYRLMFSEDAPKQSCVLSDNSYPVAFSQPPGCILTGKQLSEQKECVVLSRITSV